MRVLLASIGVIAYSLAVLGSVAMTGDIGLRCVFGNKIKDVILYPWNSEPIAVREELRSARSSLDQFSARPPKVGDTLRSLGPYAVNNYRDYVKALRAVSRRIGEPVMVRWEDGLASRYGIVRIQPPPLWTYIWSLVWFLQEMLVFALGARVLLKRPKDVSARLFFWITVVTVGAFMGGYHWSRIVIHQPLIFLFAAFAVMVPVLSLHFYLVFPRENPIYRARRRLVLTWLYGLPAVGLAGMWATMLWSTFDRDSLRVETALFLLRNIALGYVGAAVLLFVLCLACLVYSFLKANDRSERNQVQWILLATLLAFAPISYLLWDTWNDPARLGLTSSAWPMVIVSLLYTTAYAISITRYKLMRAEEFLNRGVVYFLVTFAAGLLYSGLLVAVTLVVDESPLADRTGLGAIVVGVTALVILALWELARQRFQKAIDRRFYREKYKFDQAMKKMGQAVGSLVDRPTLGRRLLEAATEVLRLEWGAIYLCDVPEGPMRVVASHGPEPDDKVIEADNPLVMWLRDSPTIRAPIALATISDPAVDALIALGGEVATALELDDALAGLLVLGPKRSGMPYEDEEIAFLGALGSVAALALRSADIQSTLAGLNQELRDKVDKIAEQQRRILILQDQLAHQREPIDGESSRHDRIPSADASAFAAIRGSSPAVRQLLDVARKVAASPSAVLIRGESGTGKELLAEAIHAASLRAGKPFVKVHCAALSQNLLESELFGHVRGAFTGADRDRVGRFQQADGGTLLLDEIGDINWEVQTKLLRVVQEMSFERVGSSQALKVDVRILAATHQDLEALIRDGKFREDLYYRLNVISLRTPALRERKDDIFELAIHFLNEHARRAGKPVTHLEEAAIEALMAHDWPGNIRELENVLERAVVLADGPALTLDDLPAEVRRPSRRRTRSMSPVLVPSAVRSLVTTPAGRAPAVEDEDDPEFAAFERQRLVDALDGARGNKSEAARLLGMPRSTFFSKLKKHNLT